jgi:hypothetical protein
LSGNLIVVVVFGSRGSLAQEAEARGERVQGSNRVGLIKLNGKKRQRKKGKEKRWTKSVDSEGATTNQQNNRTRSQEGGNHRKKRTKGREMNSYSRRARGTREGR